MFSNVKVVPSSDTNVKKFVFEYADRPAVAEAVLYKYGEYNTRTVICCSTQSGCPVGCRFCGAGDYFVRSLTGDEIVAQVEHLFQVEGINPAEVEKLQVMFMSMGEPMLNFKGLEDACRTLYGKYPNARLLISTSGPRVDYAPLVLLSMEIPTIGLQFSVHESTNEERNKLIPFEAKLCLEEIAEVGEMWYEATGRRPFFNYCAHEKNTGMTNAIQLSRFFEPNIWEATISVICERDESVAAANLRQKQLADDFEAKLRNRGFNTRVFNPAGQDDIGGGCGQLWFVQNWMKKHPELVRPSVGNGLDVIHTPT
jgi:23S rRNA (adenine2503-C2)-methyltransferase